MLSILLLSHKGEGHELIDRLIKEGHHVKYWVETKVDPPVQAKHAGQAVDSYTGHLPTTDLVVSFNARNGGRCESLREGGKLVVGGGVQSLVEGNEAFRHSLVKLLDLKETNVVDGPRVILCGWFNGKDFLYSYVVQHYSRMLDGERGPSVTNMGYVAKVEPSTILHRIIPTLQELDYRGFFGVELVYSKDQAKLLEFVLNPSGGLLAAISECTNLALGEMLYSVASGNQYIPLRPNGTQYGIAVNIQYLDQMPVKPDDPKVGKHIWESYSPQCLGYISARGEDVREARRRAYRTIANHTTIDALYRRDIGANSIWEWQEENNVSAQVRA